MVVLKIKPLSGSTDGVALVVRDVSVYLASIQTLFAQQYAACFPSRGRMFCRRLLSDVEQSGGRYVYPPDYKLEDILQGRTEIFLTADLITQQDAVAAGLVEAAVPRDALASGTATSHKKRKCAEGGNPGGQPSAEELAGKSKMRVSDAARANGHADPSSTSDQRNGWQIRGPSRSHISTKCAKCRSAKKGGCGTASALKSCLFHPDLKRKEAGREGSAGGGVLGGEGSFGEGLSVKSDSGNMALEMDGQGILAGVGGSGGMGNLLGPDLADLGRSVVSGEMR